MDKDLMFLKEVSNEELSVFVEIMLDKGKLTERLTKSDEYKKFGDDYKSYVDKISDEYLTFGTNTFKNFVYSGRKTYKDILCDIAKHKDVKFDKTSKVDVIESLLLEKLLVDSWRKLSDSVKEELMNEFEPNEKYISTSQLKEATWLLELFRKNDLTAYKIILFIEDQISTSLLGRSLKTAVKFVFARIIFGPASWVYAIYSIAGPAYRVMVPCTILVAAMRRRLLLKNKLGIKDF